MTDLSIKVLLTHEFTISHSSFTIYNVTIILKKKNYVIICDTKFFFFFFPINMKLDKVERA